MASEAEKRTLIINTGMAEVDAGSHYTKGGDGAIPAQPGTGLFRELELVQDLTLENLGVHAARNSFGVCRGRWDVFVDGKIIKKPMPERVTLLPEYLTELSKSYLPTDYWWDFNKTGLYPRNSGGYIYLGEDCRNKKHFDCEGFVAWVLVKAAGKDKGTWRKGVDWYQSGGDGRLDIYKASGNQYESKILGKVIKTSDILDGDILIRKPGPNGGEHIALACAKGSGVLEATNRDHGVHHRAYKSDWTELARIKVL